MKGKIIIVVEKGEIEAFASLLAVCRKYNYNYATVHKHVSGSGEYYDKKTKRTVIPTEIQY